MGFAGQVFAARVAIGLAFPSKQAMGQASQIIGAGASALYKKMNSMQVQQASKRKTLAERELKEMENRIQKHRNTLQQKLTAGQAKFSTSLKQSNIATKVTAGQSMKAYKAAQKTMGTSKGTKHIENTFKAGKRAFTDFASHVKARSPDLAISLFGKEGSRGGPGKLHDSFDIGKLSKVMGEGTAKQRKELLTIAKLEAENAARRKKNGLEEIKMMQMKINFLRALGDTHGITAEQFAEANDQLIEEKRGFEDNERAASEFYGVIKNMADQRAADEKEHNDELQGMLKEERSLRDTLKQAIKGEEDALKLLEQGAQRAAKKAMQLAEALKTNFGNALRESISALTALFYKLQQNSQELIEFERELMNANSVFNLTRKELFETAETVTQFGQSFGLEMQNGAEGLYQLASAGLSADQATKVLPETLKLSMAVQGDHNTIAKLTTQTLMGFSMEMEQAGEVTDKFAHVIQKSLIEYEDLTSAVKFAMPFFTATGQSVDQLLGALEVLTNRALEAGIAGRGLRQALAEFAEHADDNTAAFARMGLEIKKADGSMKDLTVIAKEYSDIIGPEAASNTELLTALIDDLNVRGATAFVHLVQNADEFAQAVEDVENAGGELDEMVRIQNESMSAQIQILKNNIQMIFFYNDGVERANGAMNGFHSAIIDGITGFQDLLVTGEEGNKQLTEFGKTIQDVAVEAVRALTVLLQDGVKFLAEFSGEGKQAVGVLKAYLIPIQVLMKATKILGPRLTSLIIQFTMLNKLFSLTTGIRLLVGFIYQHVFATTASTQAINAETMALEGNTAAKVKNGSATVGVTGAAGGSGGARGGGMLAGLGGMFGFGGGGGQGVDDIYKTDKGKYRLKGMKGGGFASKEALMKSKGIKPKISMFQKLTNVLRPMGKLGMQVARGLGTAAGAAAALVAVVVGLVAYGTSLMGTFGPLVDIFKGWGEAVINLTKWVGEGLYWGIKKVVLTIGQWAQSLGIVGVAMGDVQLTTANAMKEMGYMIQRTLMRWSMWFGGTFGFIVFVIDQAFKKIYEGVMYWIGNSKIPEAIIGGFAKLWDSLFNSETGWLRWLTLGWWTGKFQAISDWWDGGQGLVNLMNTTVDLGKSIFGSMTSWFSDTFGPDGPVQSAMLGFLTWFQEKWDNLVGLLKSPAEIIKQREITAEQQELANQYVAGDINKGEAMSQQEGAAGNVGKAFYGSEGTGYAGTKYSLGGMVDYISGENRTGGYIKAMQTGGRAMGQGAYLVGEAGPELFIPDSSGQVINNSRTESILRNQLNSGLNSGMKGSGGVISVDSIVANRAAMGKSKISVDTFAGVV
tara:strand:+ start:6412 stop:10350 length:3939 start_codon:yes stop_codon:yes gene_type:complete